MKKLNLQLGSIKEMLTKEQMKKVVGGYAATTTTTTKSPKIAACDGKKEGDACSWSYQGTTQNGFCRTYLSTALHCSDLN